MNNAKTIKTYLLIIFSLLLLGCSSSSQPIATDGAQDESIYTTVVTMIDTMPTDVETAPTLPSMPPPTDPALTEPQPTEIQPTVTIPTIMEPTESQHPANYYGRLCILEAGINVALYCGADQEICDRQDSANIFTMSVFDGLYISDHGNQEFSKLFGVKVGMHGYIQLADGQTLSITCVDVLNGYNTGKYITDEYGQTNFDADYLMYTCRNGWRNIIICLWKCG